MGTAGPWTIGGTETEDSPLGPPQGEGAALFSPSPEKQKIPTSSGFPRQGRFVDFLDDLGPGWDTGGAALLREARRAGLGFDSAWGGAALEDAGGRPWRLRPGPGSNGGWCITPGRMCWIASVCCCTGENCWAKPSTVLPNSPAWEMGASRKRALSTSFISARLSQRWRSLTTMVDIAFQRDRAMNFVARRTKSVAVRSSCINTELVLPSCTTLCGCQLTGFGRETWTVPPSGGVSWAQVHRDRSLHLGNARVPPGSPAVEGSEDGGSWASGFWL